MKQQSSFAALILFSIFFFAGCDASGTTGTAGGGSTGANLTRADFPLTATGGDPRGTYSPNTPFIQIFHSDTNIVITEVAGGSNTGSGTIKLEGTSATSGTYKSTGVTLNVNFSVTISHMGHSQTATFKDDFSSISGNSSGTWQVVGSDKIIFRDSSHTSSPDTLLYAVTSKGFFFGTVEDDASGSVVIIGAFKK